MGGTSRNKDRVAQENLVTVWLSGNQHVQTSLYSTRRGKLVGSIQLSVSLSPLMSASLMRLFHLAGASAKRTLSFTGEVFCDRASASVNICPAITDDSEDIPLRQKWNDTTYFDLDYYVWFLQACPL